MCQDESIYYVNGTTGETTFDKPRSLMSPQELVYFDNFVSHQKAAEGHVEKIDKLQHEVEALKYERDMRLASDAHKMGSGGGGGAAKKGNDGAATLANAKSAKVKGLFCVVVLCFPASCSVWRPNCNSLRSQQAGPLAFLSGISRAYKDRLLNPEERVRGQNRSDYIKGLIQNHDD